LLADLADLLHCRVDLVTYDGPDHSPAEHHAGNDAVADGDGLSTMRLSGGGFLDEFERTLGASPAGAATVEEFGARFANLTFTAAAVRWLRAMNAALDLSDLTRLNQAPLDHMTELGAKLDVADEARRNAFCREVAAVGGVLKQTYQAAALLAKRAANCEEAGQTWKTMSEYANRVMIVLSLLKDRYPDSGTAELYDLALDYKAAAEKRYQSNLEATLCQKTPLPEGLLPPLTSFV
jgi:hypothetical protein